MFRKILDKVETLLTESENRRHEAYLTQSTDLFELERRSRYYESSHNPFAFFERYDFHDWRH